MFLKSGFKGIFMRHRLFPASGVLLLTLLLGACASGPTIIANHDPNADFSAYKTFSFIDPLSTDRAGASGVLSGFLIKATSAELEARGMKRGWPDPDLLIDFVVSAQQTIQSRSQPSSSATMHRGRGGYGTWSGYSMSMSTTTATQKTEGTVAIDVIDRKRKQIVWEAAATGRVTEKTRDNLQSAVPIVVGELFQKYPVPRPK
jgi:hypothetical protein